jgi:plastocyanin
MAVMTVVFHNYLRLSNIVPLLIPLNSISLEHYTGYEFIQIHTRLNTFMADSKQKMFMSRFEKVALIAAISLLTLALITPLASNASSIVSVSIPQGAAIFGHTSFSPDPAEISVGDSINWTNDDAIIHWVRSGVSATTYGLFDTDILAPHSSKVIEFDSPGTFPYFCQIHPFMVGQVKVSMFVVPESPIGSIALIAASLGSFGVFMVLRTRRNNGANISTKGLGI